MPQSRSLRFVAIATGIAAILIASLAGVIAFGTAAPPAHSMAPRQLDLSGLPALSRYTARDGARLAYRFYPANGSEAVILLHGSGTESSVMNAAAKVLNADGVAVYAPDLRGHGASGRRGDIDYIGQLDDDIADLAALARKNSPRAKLTLIGFSGGGALTIRIAGGKYGGLFDRYILIDPAIVYPSPIAKPNAGGWATPYVPRIAGLMVLNVLGIHAFDGLTAIVFAVPPNRPNMTASYSFRLAMNLNSAGYFEALQRTKRPMALIAGAADDQFYAGKYAPAFKPAKPDLLVRLVPGMDHVDMISKPPALAALREAFDTLRH
ncbi:MAG TPA: alpha/beta fold hydrolase [Rhizomicrobium sp.]|nr:alpha/beta fold hydrolase [Rhizomicrobium sp.]